jgi:hypothetical protein
MHMYPLLPDIFAKIPISTHDIRMRTYDFIDCLDGRP